MWTKCQSSGIFLCELIRKLNSERNYSDRDECPPQWHEKVFVMHRFGEGQTPRSLQAIRAEVDRLEQLAADLEMVSGTVPFSADQMLVRAYPAAPILDEWRVAVRPVVCLVGLSTGHPRLPGDRRSIVTSEIFLISEELGWARSFSRWYRLGRRLDDAAGNC